MHRPNESHTAFIKILKHGQVSAKRVAVLDRLEDDPLALRNDALSIISRVGQFECVRMSLDHCEDIV